MSLPYKVRFKLPLEYLTLQDWNNFVQNLLFINQYGSAKLLQYYQNGNFQNLNDVIAKYLYVSALKVMGYNVLHNLSEPLAYTFGEGNQQPFESMSNRPTVSFPYSIPFEFIQFYPISKLPNYQFPVFPISKLQVQLSQVSKQLQLLIPKLISKIVTPNQIAGTQFQFSGTATVEDLVNNYLNPQYLETWREIVIQNLGSSAIQINNAIYLMPKQCLRITASSPSEIQLTAQTPTLLSEEIEFIGTPIIAYTITITNSQANPTPSTFQQLLNLNLSSILSSSSQLLNLQFCLDVNCNTPLYAWIESYNSNLSSVYIWVNLPVSIPANSSITIYMFIRNSIQYPYTGMSPTLTSTYAQYDNGGNIFTFYDNFAGTTLSSKWIKITVPPSGVITVNNGVSIINTGNTIYYVSSQSFTAPYIIDQAGILGDHADDGPWFDLESTTSSAGTGYLWATRGLSSSSNDQLYTDNNGSYSAFATASGTSGSSNFTIYTLEDVGGSSGTINTYVNYSSWLSSSSTTFPHSGYFSPFRHYNNSTPASIIYWVRVRAYPPNGIMPSNSQPQKTIVLVG